MDHNRTLGAAGEEAAWAWYRSAGFSLEARNWRVRAGEIDLIVSAGPLLVVCEVKTRSSDRFGVPAEAVTWTKQRRLRTLATEWLACQDRAWPQVRFDVAAVTPMGPSHRVEVIEGAF
jgi:putative endonuclease